MTEDQSVERLAAQLQEISKRLNASRVLTEPRPSSRIPLLWPLINLVRRWLNTLATRWYVAPQMEQQARFAQEMTAAYDYLAATLVFLAQRLDEHACRLDELEEKLDELKRNLLALRSSSAVPPPDFADLLSLPPEALLAWENADLPPPRTESAPGMEWAKWYDRENALTFPLLRSDQVTAWHYLFSLAVCGVALNCRPGDLVLDLAGGPGWVSEHLNRLGIRTVLLDIVEDLLHTSRLRFSLDRRLQKGAVHHSVVGDALRLPFAEATFDGIICMNALHHMPSYEVVLREIFRVLKPGGRAVFGEPGEGHARAPASQSAMREYGVIEKNVPLPLLYVYAKRVGFVRMWRYPFAYPEALELSYPEEAGSDAGVLQRMALVLPDWLRTLSFFALEKEGRELPTSDLRPLEQVRHRLQAEIVLLRSFPQVPAGSRFVQRVRVRNVGDVVWLAGERPYGGYVRLGIKLGDGAGRLIRDDWLRVTLPHDVAPEEEVEFDISVQTPTIPGTYTLIYDLVNEGRAWFQTYGSRAVEQPLQVVDAG